MYDRNPVRRNPMNENAIDSANIGKPAPETAKKAGRKAAKPAKKCGKAKNAIYKPKADRTNKKAEVIAMMKRAKGATLSEIMNARAGSRTRCGASSAFWAAREVRRSSRPRTPRANERTRSGNSSRQLVVQTPSRPRARGGVSALRRK
jgi:hypothetical protein